MTTDRGDRAVALRMLTGWLQAIRQQNKAIRRKNKLIKRLRADVARLNTVPLQQQNWNLVHDNIELRKQLTIIKMRQNEY